MQISRKATVAATSITSTLCGPACGGNGYSKRSSLPVIATAALIIVVVIATSILLGGTGPSERVPKQSTNLQTKYSTMRDSDVADVNAGIGYESSSLPWVRFEQVQTEDDVLRYAAYKVSEDGTSSKNGSTRMDLTPLFMAEWIRLMTHDDRAYSESLAMNITKVLQGASYGAFRFETPGVSAESVERSPFEFVLVKDPYLETFAAKADPVPFSEFLTSSACTGSGSDDNGTDPAACAFTNLGGDARLVAPRVWPADPSSNESTNVNRYGHLAAFVRGASEQQIVHVWRMVAETLKGELLDGGRRPHDKPLWFSTAGTGVAWLHFRLDSRPKYYLYKPFMEYKSHREA